MFSEYPSHKIEKIQQEVPYVMKKFNESSHIEFFETCFWDDRRSHSVFPGSYLNFLMLLVNVFCMKL